MTEDPNDIPEGDDASAESAEGFRSGYVAVVGAPNVGKSTLVNAFLGQKLAIVSPKPQTTRHRIMGILTEEDYQIIFVDTPGVHRPHNPFGEYMVAMADEAVADADVILWLTDFTRDPNHDDERTAEALRAVSGVPIALVLNKLDLASEAVRLSRQAQYGALAQGIDVRFRVSAATREGLDHLLAWVVEQLPPGPQYYPTEQVTDREERFLVAELVREQVLLNLREEVPHAVAVTLDDFVERDEGKTYIAATLFVEKESQKRILVGAGGAVLRRISTAARLQAEKLLETPVYLQLWVKVRPNWRRNQGYLRELGFSVKRDSE